MVEMSANSGMLVSVSGSGVSNVAAISGRAAFLAPPMTISPCSGLPPLIRIASTQPFLRTRGAYTSPFMASL